MKIAVFTDLYIPSGTGGIISSIKAQKDELEKLGHEVVVFCPGFENKEKNVVLVPCFSFVKVNGAILARGPKKIVQFVLDEYPDFGEFDVVHVNYEASCSIAGILLAKKFGIPLVQTMHGREDMAIQTNVPVGFRGISAFGLERMHAHYLPHTQKVKKDKFLAPTQVRAWMWKMMVNHANNADVVVVPADHFGKKLEHYGVEKPIVLVPNGLPEEFTEPEFPVREYADGDVLRMVWGSRVSNEKRFMEFLQAVKQMKRPYVLYVFGSGNALKPGKRYARKHNLKVKFFGAQPRSKIIKKMKESHLGVCTSYNFDTQGMVLIEAEATGLPAFLCDPTLVEVIPQGGYIIAGGPDATSMAIALDGFDPKQIEKMSKVMMKHRKETAQSVQIKKLLKAFQLAIDSKKE